MNGCMDGVRKDKEQVVLFVQIAIYHHFNKYLLSLPLTFHKSNS